MASNRKRYVFHSRILCSYLWASLAGPFPFGEDPACAPHIRSHIDTSSKMPESPPDLSSGFNASKESEIDANIRNFAPVARIMKNALPENAKIAKEAKECMQECVSEFISFITSEGTPAHAADQGEATVLTSERHPASEKCQQEKRKTVNGEDILFAMTSLGFENYAEALKVYLSKYREVRLHLPWLIARKALVLTLECSNKISQTVNVSWIATQAGRAA